MPLRSLKLALASLSLDLDTTRSLALPDRLARKLAPRLHASRSPKLYLANATRSPPPLPGQDVEIWAPLTGEAAACAESKTRLPLAQRASPSPPRVSSAVIGASR